jgi:hypothetical protein
MLSNRILRAVLVSASILVAILTPAGCGSSGSALPDTVTVNLPDGTTSEVTLGSGVASLANTTWHFFLSSEAAQSTPFVVVSFGDEGNLEAFYENTLASEIFGSQILFDGERHNTTQQGLSYAAATYGAQTSDASGFAFEGRLSAFAAGFKVASGEASATGMFDPENPNRMTGTFSFGYDIEVSVPCVPTEGADDSFGFVAERIVE